MPRILLILLPLAACAAEAVPPAPAVRDPFAPLPPAAVQAAGAASVQARLPRLDGLARSGTTVLGVFHLAGRWTLAAAGSDIVLDGERFAFVAGDDQAASLRDRDGGMHELRIALPASAAAPAPADQSPPPSR